MGRRRVVSKPILSSGRKITNPVLSVIWKPQTRSFFAQVVKSSLKITDGGFQKYFLGHEIFTYEQVMIPSLLVSIRK
jgi:hypothetical protein